MSVAGTGWHVAAASVLGTDHARAAAGCQDAYTVRRRDSALVIAAADGGGQARLSAVGAHLACALAVDETCLRLDRSGAVAGKSWHRLLRAVTDSVVGHFTAAAEQVASRFTETGPGALGTTLTLVVADPPWVAAAAIGDGFVVTRCGAAHLDLLLPPDETAAEVPIAQRRSGHTVFVTSPRAGAQARFAVAHLPDLTGVAVSTDGLRDVALQHEAAVAQLPYRKFFEPVFAKVTDHASDATLLLRLLASPQICELTGDDKTLIVGVTP